MTFESIPNVFRAAFLMAASVGTCAAACGAEPGQWLQWRGPDRAGKCVEEGLRFRWDQQPPKLAWSASGMGSGYASLTIADGVGYTTGNVGGKQAVIAVDLAKGEVLWSRPVTDSVPKHGYKGSRCTPTIDGPRLFVVSSDGRLTCLSRRNGAIAWSHDFASSGGRMMSGWGFSESPLVDGDRVIATPGAPGAALAAWDAKSGRLLWKAAAPGNPAAAYASMVVSNAGGVRQYVQLMGSGLISVSAKDGRFLWRYDRIANGTANIPTPLVQGDFVFTSTGYGTGSALLKVKRGGRGVQEVYFLKARTFENHHGGLIAHEGHVYAGHKHNEGYPICVRVSDGEVVWGGDQRGVGRGSAAVLQVGDVLIFRYQSGHVAAIRATPTKYELLGSFMPDYQEGNSWAHPVVVDGKLYLREQDKLMCYDLR